MNRSQIRKWICKIDEKALQIKDMADCILKYSLQKRPSDPAVVRPESFHSAFYDTLSETCVCLEQKGFHLQLTLTFEDHTIHIDPKYIARILDNICSNITLTASV